jgi:hypothetical protein
MFALLPILMLSGSLGGCGDGASAQSQTSGNSGIRSATLGESGLRSDQIGLLREKFSLFRGNPEGLPANVEKVLGHHIYGSKWSLAQRIPAVRMAKMWAVPGQRHVCIFSEQTPKIVGATCDSTDGVIRHGLFSAFLSETDPHGSPIQRVIVGIAPDGVRAVVAHNSRSAVRLRVVRDVFRHSDQATRPPNRLTLIY